LGTTRRTDGIGLVSARGAASRLEAAARAF
jgi:hypothetical protein